MKIYNPIQFAVVREDPEIELHLINQIPENGKALLIGSGGCTALSIAARYPYITQTLVDSNRSQLELIKHKLHVLTTKSQIQIADEFGIGCHSSASLISCGNFESLFKSFRLFLYEFVMPYSEWLNFFENNSIPDFPRMIFTSKYWHIAFELFFSDLLLIGLFGPEAVQHAASAYPKYFQKKLEKGLQSQNAGENYFLHHIFLGHYLNKPHALPPYLLNTPSLFQPHVFKYENVFSEDYLSFAQHDLLSFSNIFDWMDEEKIKIIAERIIKEMKPGAWLVYRQLNNHKNLRPLFKGALQFDDELGQALHHQDRSLFYSSLHIAQKN